MKTKHHKIAKQIEYILEEVQFVNQKKSRTVILIKIVFIRLFLYILLNIFSFSFNINKQNKFSNWFSFSFVKCVEKNVSKKQFIHTILLITDLKMFSFFFLFLFFNHLVGLYRFIRFYFIFF